MCGIAGYIGQGHQEKTRRMTDLQYHRGPDDFGYFDDCENSISLGHRRLSIIDIKGGKQPLYNEDKTLALVYNGEIYNFRQLRDILQKKGHRFQTGTDSEVIVHGYEEYGESLPQKLEGMFAFALWDAKTKSLFCARDRFGIKPFYYSNANGKFLFASEQKAVSAVFDEELSVNLNSFFSYFVIGFLTSNESIFKHIKSLAPGHALTWKEGSIKTQVYWSPRYADHKESVDLQGTLGNVREKVKSSVRSHLLSDVPVGLTLSGGLDSSIIAAVLAELRKEIGGNEKIQAYTVGFGLLTDETPYAEMICKMHGIDIQKRSVDPESAIEELPAIIWHLEEPSTNVTAITAYQWAKAIASDRKVTLVGEGADELFGGYPQYKMFVPPFSILPMEVSAKLYRYMFLQPPLGIINKLVGHLPDSENEIETVYYEDYLGAYKKRNSSLESVLEFDSKYQLPNNQLNRVDKMSMAHSLEARVPFLDNDLFDLVWRLPDKLKINGSIQKYILREAFKGKLPREIYKRPKIGKKGSQSLFPIVKNIAIDKYLKNMISSGRFKGTAYFSRATLNALMEGRLGNYPVVGDRIRLKLLYSVFMFLLWHQIFIDNPKQDYRQVSLKDLINW
jgi:asparagine synthase (glutamine-hydrolysing)